MTKKNTMQAWLVVFGSGLLMLAQTGIGSNTLGLYLLPATEDMGISRTEFSAIFTLMSAVGIPLSLVLSTVMKKIGSTACVIGGAVLQGIGMLSVAFAKNPMMLYLGGILMGFGTIFAGLILAQTFVANWFVKGRGTAIGVTGTMLGVGTAIFSPILSNMIGAIGWRRSMMINALMSVILMIIAKLVFIKDTPEDLGMHPIGAEETEKVNSGIQTVTGMETKAVLNTKLFWMLAAAMFLISIVNQCVMTQQSAMIVDKGFTLEQAALVISVYSIVNTVNKLFAGVVVDKAGFKTTLFYIAVCTCGAILIMLYANNFSMMLMYGILYGTWPAVSSLYTTSTLPILFGRKNFVTINSWLFAILSFGAVVGPVFSAGMYDANGSYTLPLWCAFGATIIILIITFIVLQKKHYYAE